MLLRGISVLESPVDEATAGDVALDRFAPRRRPTPFGFVIATTACPHDGITLATTIRTTRCSPSCRVVS